MGLLRHSHARIGFFNMFVSDCADLLQTPLYSSARSNSQTTSSLHLIRLSMRQQSGSFSAITPDRTKSREKRARTERTQLLFIPYSNLLSSLVQVPLPERQPAHSRQAHDPKPMHGCRSWSAVPLAERRAIFYARCGSQGMAHAGAGELSGLQAKIRSLTECEYSSACYRLSSRARQFKQRGFCLHPFEMTIRSSSSSPRSCIARAVSESLSGFL